MARQKTGGREYVNVEASLDGDPGTRARVKEISERMGKNKLNRAHCACQDIGMRVVEGDFTGVRDPALEAERLDARHGEAYLAIARSVGNGVAMRDAAETAYERCVRLIDALTDAS